MDDTRATETLRHATKRPVVTADTAEALGEMTGLVLRQPPTSASALAVGGRGSVSGVVDWEHVKFGPDAIVVDRADSVRDPRGDDEQQAVERGRALLGSRVLDTRGFERGEVDDAEFDPATGELVALSLPALRVERGQVRGLGSYALVVDVGDA